MAQPMIELIVKIREKTNAGLNEINRAILMFERQGYNNDWMKEHADAICRYIEFRTQAVARYKMIDGKKVRYTDVDYIKLAIKNTEG